MEGKSLVFCLARSLPLAFLLPPFVGGQLRLFVSSLFFVVDVGDEIVDVEENEIDEANEPDESEELEDVDLLDFFVFFVVFSFDVVSGSNGISSS